MEDSFELLIYIVFIVVSLLGGLYKNYQKKQAEERKRRRAHDSEEMSEPYPELNDEEPAPKRNPLEEFLKQQLEGIEPEEQFIEEQEPEPVVEPTIDHTTLESPMVVEGSSAFTSTDQTLISDDIHENPEKTFEEIYDSYDHEHNEIYDHDLTEPENAILEDFDAKKGIIYSEILKRPEY